MNKKNFRLTGILIAALLLGSLLLGYCSLLFTDDTQDTDITEDTYMTTKAFNTTIRVTEDNSYIVTEDISVVFDTSRHGIYRYIPQKGFISEVNDSGKLTQIPYYTKFKDVTSSHELYDESENGNRVFRFGEEDVTVKGAQEYSFSYHVVPVTSNGYTNAYYNIYPTGWRNEIPEGSTFSIEFPKDFDHDLLRLYYGNYGEQKDGSGIVTLSWDGNTVTGTLKQSLNTGSGMTFYVQMPKGYFTGSNTTVLLNRGWVIASIAILIILIVLFLAFGKDKAIIPSIQYQPPDGLDSAVVGYIVDGVISNEDITSLLIYWADKGFIKICEKKKGSLSLVKMKELPKDAPYHSKLIFKKIFGKDQDSIGKEVKLSKLKYKMTSTITKAKASIIKQYKNSIYTTSSKVARWISAVLTIAPLLIFSIYMKICLAINLFFFALILLYVVGGFLLCLTVDNWYSSSGNTRASMTGVSLGLSIGSLVSYIAIFGIKMLQEQMLNLFPALLSVCILSALGTLFTAFMKKRTSQCIEWMGHLAGLRNFIEVAELERMQVIAEDNPQLFYHILTYSYVFGLSDILLEKMSALTIPAPEWYEPHDRMDMFDYAIMYHMMHSDLKDVSTVIFAPKPESLSSSVSGSSFGGCGFSGGGFGGGGGGSW